MTDPLSLAVTPQAAAGTAPQAQAKPDPHEARQFAELMQGTPTVAAKPDGIAHSLGETAQAYARQLSSGRSVEEIRHSMLAAIDPNDPVKTMFAMTDLSMEAQATFSKLHIATGLASAATSLFGTLLKNQQ
jgi:hypothetical protein